VTTYEERRREFLANGGAPTEGVDLPNMAARAVRAAQGSPDQAGEARRVSGQTGLALPYVRERLDEARARAQAADVQAQVSDAPRAARFVADNADIARDDAGNLADMERQFTGNIPRSMSVIPTRAEYRRALAARGQTPETARARAPSAAAFAEREAVAADVTQRRERSNRGVFRQVLGALEAGTATAASGLYELAAAFVKPTEGIQNFIGRDVLGNSEFDGSRTTNLLLDIGRTADDRAERVRARGRNFVSDSLYSGLESLPLMGAALATGSTSAGLTLFGLVTGGNAFGDATRQGLPWLEAFRHAGRQGLIEAGTELLPLGTAMRHIKNSTPTGRFIRDYLLQEMGTEQLATFLQDFDTQATLTPNRPWLEFWLERPEAAAQTALATLAAVGPVALATEGGRFAHNRAREEQQTQRAEQATNLFEQIGKLAEASNVQTRDVSSFEAFVASAAEGTEATDVFVDPEKLGELLDQSELSQEFLDANPEIESAIDSAIESGTDVRIPIEQFAGRIANTDVGEALLPHLKLSPADSTQAEADVFMQGALDNAESEAAAAVDRLGQSEEFNQSAERVQERVLSELTSANRFTADVNKPLAALHSAFYATLATRTGQTPEQVADTYGLKVQAESVAGEGVLDQQQPGDAAWTPTRIGNLLSTYAVSHEPDHTKSYVTYVSPQEFVDVTTPRELQGDLKTEAGALDEKKLAGESQPVFLLVEEEGENSGVFKVVGHEGRHRVAALAKAGVARVPIVVERRDTGWAPLAEQKSVVLLAQRHGGGVAGAKNVVTGELVPLTYNNKARIEQDFGRGEILFQQPDHYELRSLVADIGTGRETFLQRSDWVIFSAENPNAKPLSEEENAARTEKLRTALTNMGVPFRPAIGRYTELDENSFMVGSLTRRQQIELGKEWGQESVLTNLGLVYMDGSGVHRATGARQFRTAEELEAHEDGYTEIDGYRFTVDMDFSRKITLANAEELSVLEPTRLSTPPINEDGTITLQHFSTESGLTTTDPLMWGKSGRFLSPGERARIGSAPWRTFFGIATGQPGGYRSEFGTARTVYEANIPREALYDIRADTAGLRRGHPLNDPTAQRASGKDAYERRIAEAGFAGYWIRDDLHGLVAVVFNPVEVRKIAEKGETFYQSENPVFYSALERLLEESTTQSAPAQQWINTLNKAPGIKQDELEWSGVIDQLEFLARSDTGNIDREGLLGMARRGGVKVEEVILGEPQADRWDNPLWVEARQNFIDDRLADIGSRTPSLIETHFAEEVEQDDPDAEVRYAVYGAFSENETFSTLAEAEQHADDLNDQQRRVALDELEEVHGRAADDFADEAVGIQGTQFEDYASGGANYRELLITLPALEGPSTHFDTPNVVAHLRLSEHRDDQGQRVMFIEEVQSDWHQKGREQGYKAIASKEEIRAAEAAWRDAVAARDEVLLDIIGYADEAGAAYETGWPASRIAAAAAQKIVSDAGVGSDRAKAALDEQQRLGDAYIFSSLRAVEARSALDRARSGSGIPEAPFKTTWPELVMKRAVRYAVDNGYQRVAWTTGEQQNERYNLGQVLGHLTADRRELEGDKIAVNAGSQAANRAIAEQTSGETNSLSWPVLTREEAVSTFGENIAGQLFDPAQDGQTFEVEDLRVGGQGMITFYDKMLPSITGKLIKKHGGKVVPMVIPEFAKPAPEAKYAVERLRRMLSSFVENEIYPKNRSAGGNYVFVVLPQSKKQYDATVARAEEGSHEQNEMKALLPDLEKMWALNSELIDAQAAAENSLLEKPTNLGFDITPELAAAAGSGFPLFHRTGDGPPRGQISLPADISQSPATITLLRGADLSTFLHETGHFFFEVMAHAATAPGADAQLTADANALVAFAGASSIEEWRGLSTEQRREGHERVARAFEAYLFEGRAPSAKLLPLFRRFSGWLKRVYQSLTALNVELTPEVREVFDRMLATEEDIKDAESDARLDAAFTEKPDGMSDAEWADYQRMHADATARAEEELQSRSLRDMRFAGRAAGRELKKLQADVKSIRDAVRAEVEEEVVTEEVYRAMYLLRRGILDGEQTDPVKLSIPAVNDMFADRSAEELKKIKTQLGYGKYGMLAKAGEHPDTVAQLLDFTSGDHLINALLAAPPLAERVDADTDQRMLERYGDITSPEAMQAAAEQAVHNDVRMRFVATEVKAAAKATGSVRELMRAAKRYAEQLIGRQPVGKLRPDLYTAAERRAAKAFAEAKTPAEAAIAKRNQLLNMASTKAARDAQTEMDRALRYARKFERAGVRKSIDEEYLDQIDAILEKHELRKAVTRKEMAERRSYAEWAAKQEADTGVSPLFEEGDLPPSVHWRDLSVDDARAMMDVVRNIEAMGRLKTKMLTAADKARFADAVASIEASIKEHSYKTNAQPFGSKSKWEIVKGGLADFIAVHRKLANTVFVMDGNKYNGVFWNYLTRAMNVAGDNEAAMNEDATTQLTALFKPLVSANNISKRTYVPELDRSLSLQDRIMVALNWGNELNRRRILDGDKLTPGQVEVIFDGLTAEHWDFVEGVWDYLGSYWPKVAAKEKRVTGVTPKGVEADAFTVTVDGVERTLAGGYFPIKYDPEKSSQAESHAEADVLKQMMQGSFTRATTRRGHTKARVDKVERTVRKDFGVVFEHVAQVIHDLAQHEFLIDANRLLNAPAIDGAIRDHYGPQTLRWMKKAITDIAVGDIPTLTSLEKGMTHIRVGATIAGLGWKVWTSLLQPVGLTQSIVRVGPKYIARGIVQSFKSAVGMEAIVESVSEKSTFMRLRTKTMQREINEVRNIVSGKAQWKQNVDMSFFMFITKMQYLVDMPTWVGMYEKALDEGTDEKTAIALADQAVLDSQTGGQIKDLALVQRGNVWLKLWTNFYSFMNGAFNLLADSSAQLRRDGPAGLPRFAADYALITILPSIMIGAMRQFLRGSDDDDEEEYLAAIGSEWVGFNLGLMLGVRETSSAFTGQSGYEGPAGARAFAAINRFGGQALQGEADTAALKAANNLAGVLLHYPAGQIDATVRGVAALEEGDAGLAAPFVGPPYR